MIKFECENIDIDELKAAIENALIECVAKAIGPLYGDFERTGLDYSSCKTDEDKRQVFARDFLGVINFDKIENGVILNDELYVEGAMNDSGFDLKKLILDVKKEFPKVTVSGAGEIDYGYSMSEYEIFDCEGRISVVYDGYEEDEEYLKWDNKIECYEQEKSIDHFSDKLPRIICEDSEVIDALLAYKKQKENEIKFNKELSFALEITEARMVLIYLPINEDSIKESQEVGFPLNPQANGVLFLYGSNGDFRTNTDELIAICSVLNGSDNEWACPNPALLNILSTYYDLCVAINIYLQDKGLYKDYISMDDYTILDFQLEEGEVVSKKIIC